MSLKLIIPPSVLAVDLAQAKQELRVQSGSVEDAYISRLIRAATGRAEHRTGRAIMQQQWELLLDAFPSDGAEIELAHPPVMSVSSISYLDAAGALQVLPSSAYALDPDVQPAAVFAANGTTWPATLDVANAVRVRFVCGYGNTPAAVPDGLVDWIMVQVATHYDNRDLVAMAKADAGPDAYASRLLDPFKVYG